MLKAFIGMRILGRVFAMAWLLVMAQLASAQRPEPPPIEGRRYEDYFTFKYGTSFSKDPWTWGYTKEFADRFRMPAQWIEPELKGILAIAFRVSDIGQSVTCGLGGREDNCWPAVICQFDIYYDNSMKLPWIKESVTRDSFLTIPVSSARYMHNPYERIAQRYNSGLVGPYPLRIGFTSIERRGWHFPAGFTYYDREYASGVGLIGFQEGACQVAFKKGDYWLGVFFDKDAQEKSKGLPRSQLHGVGLIHEVLIPEPFMKRVEAARKRDTHEQEQITNRLIREFQQRQQGNGQNK